MLTFLRIKLYVGDCSGTLNLLSLKHHDNTEKLDVFIPDLQMTSTIYSLRLKYRQTPIPWPYREMKAKVLHITNIAFKSK